MIQYLCYVENVFIVRIKIKQKQNKVVYYIPHLRQCYGLNVKILKHSNKLELCVRTEMAGCPGALGLAVLSGLPAAGEASSLERGLKGHHSSLS